MTDTLPVPEPQSEDAVARLYAAVGRLNRSLRRESTTPLGYGALAALATVEADGPLRLSELADSEGVARPAVSRIVAALEERGYVSREVDPADRRAALIACTGDGRRLLARLRTGRAQVLGRRLAGLPDPDRRALLAALPALERLAEHDPDDRSTPATLPR